MCARREHGGRLIRRSVTTRNGALKVHIGWRSAALAGEGNPFEERFRLVWCQPEFTREPLDPAVSRAVHPHSELRRQFDDHRAAGSCRAGALGNVHF